MNDSLRQFDQLISQEMLVHPALFTHPKATKIAIIGGKETIILKEALKHLSLEEAWLVTAEPVATQHFHDKRAHFHLGNTSEWLKTVTPKTFDIIISIDHPDLHSKDVAETHFHYYFNALHDNGIFIQQADSLFQLETIKSIYEALRHAGFCDMQVLNFPQPNFPSGSRIALMAIKQGFFQRIREKDIFNKPFTTHYYNYDVHKAALALPEFLREELTP